VVPRVASWSIWQLPPNSIIFILAVEIAAVIPLATPARWAGADVGTALFLATLSIAYSALACRIERARRALHVGTDTARYRNLLASWTFVAAVILPLPLMVAVIAVSAVAEWPARNITGKARPYRYVYSSAGVVLAAMAARAVSQLSIPFGLGLLLAVPTYMMVGSVVVASAMTAIHQADSLRAFLRASTYRFEACTIAIALVEIELLRLHQVPMMWLSVPATIGLQRWAVRSDIRAAGGGGLQPMSEEAWLIAATEIVTALPVVSIMRINTADPTAVTTVARLQAGCDAIGYAGASGLAVLLVDCPAINADALAARLRTALQYRGVDASVAAATKARDGSCLDDLLAVCEAELITREAVNRAAKPSWQDA
jgi:hypothetical protein